MLKKITYIILLIALALLLWSSYTGYQILRYTTVSTHKQADVALVLGAAVWDDQPSPVFEERIRHAIKLYKLRQVRKIIFTGGAG